MAVIAYRLLLLLLLYLRQLYSLIPAAFVVEREDAQVAAEMVITMLTTPITNAVYAMAQEYVQVAMEQGYKPID